MSGNQTPKHQKLELRALIAFEQIIRQEPAFSADPEKFLAKVNPEEAINPEFIDKTVDGKWKNFRQGWNALLACAVTEDNPNEAAAFNDIEYWLDMETRGGGEFPSASQYAFKKYFLIPRGGDYWPFSED